MTLSKKHIFIVVLAVIIIFFAGLVVGFLIRNILPNVMNVNEKYDEKHTYKCSSTVYISNVNPEKAAISSGDLEAEALEMAPVLESDILFANIKKKIDVQYPDTEYEVQLEQTVEGVAVYYVIVTGDSKEDLQEICDLATSLLCEEIETTMSDVRCKIIEKANNPKRN